MTGREHLLLRNVKTVYFVPSRDEGRSSGRLHDNYIDYFLLINTRVLPEVIVSGLREGRPTVGGPAETEWPANRE